MSNEVNARAIKQPRYDNSNLNSYACWLSTNAYELFRYFAALEIHYEEFESLALIQYERQLYLNQQFH